MELSINIRRGWTRAFFFIALLSISLEVFFFNYRYWESKGFDEINVPEIRIGKGIKINENGTYRIDDENDAYIEIDNIKANIKNIYLDLFPESENDIGKTISLTLWVTDNANKRLIQLCDTEIINGIEESKYLRLFLIGNTNIIRVNLRPKTDCEICLKDFKLNARRPFIFHITRLVIIFLILSMIWIFRSDSPIYLVDLFKIKHRRLIFAFIAIHVLFVACVGYIFRDKNWRDTSWKANYQYNYLAESFREGHVYLPIEPPHILKEIENPYDPVQREEALQSSKEQAVTDFAYYKEKYYCYFGVVPVLIFYLPYLLLTGEPLSTNFVVIFSAAVFVVVSFCFIFTIIRRYFKNISLGMYLLLSSVFIFASEMLYSIQVPTLYSVPIIIGMVFELVGLTCWIRSVKEDGSIDKIWMTTGSITIALVLGCRPQLSVVTLLAIPIYWNQITGKQFFGFKGTGNLICAVMPFFVIYSLIMVYNFIRFGNPFDFGATYNLTGFDMVHRGWINDRFWLGFFEYFFQPFSVNSKFPYLRCVAGHMGLQSDYQGQVINEPLLGGWFSFNLIGLFVLGITRLKKMLEDRKVWGLAVISLICATIIVIVDIQMVGMTLRYLMDFSIFMTISTILVILSLFQYEFDYRLDSVLKKAVIILSMICIFTNSFSLIADGRYNSLREREFLFYTIKYCYFIRQ